MIKTFVLLLCGLLFSVTIATAQFKPKQRNNPSSINTSQWWIGVGGGVNLTGMQVLEQYHVLTPTLGDFPEKQYNSFNSLGTQFNLMVSYSFSGISLLIQPGIHHYNFTYDNRFEWQSAENPDNNIFIDNHHSHSINYLNIPLKLRYAFDFGSIVPFIQGGGYYAFLLEADKTIESRGIDNASGSSNQLPLDSQSDDITELFYPTNYGLSAGIGVMLSIGDGMATFEINYDRGFRNIVNPENRYTIDKFVTGAYNVPDDLVMSNISANFTFAIPLKFVTSKDFVPVNR
jgi:hypothetical protein